MTMFGRSMLVALIGLAATQAHAQSYWRPGDVFVCKSTDYRQNYCAADTRGGVMMRRQISGSACIQGRTWGYDRRGVWVTQGCEAEFQVAGNRPVNLALVGVLVCLGANPGVRVRIHDLADPRGGPGRVCLDHVRLVTIHAAEPQPEARVEHDEPLRRPATRVAQGLF